MKLMPASRALAMIRVEVGLVGRPAEHHRAEADRRDLQAAAAELAIFHGLSPHAFEADSIAGSFPSLRA